jgi:TRAP-type C4-dicarboxylate transport system substrate-binding protein
MNYFACLTMRAQPAGNFVQDKRHGFGVRFFGGVHIRRLYAMPPFFAVVKREDTMTKIRLFSAALAAAFAFGAYTAAPVDAKELKMAHFMSPKHPMHRALMVPMAKAFAKASGKSTIKIYVAGALGKGPREQYNRAIKGVADITFGLQGYTSPVFPRTLLAELPNNARTAAGLTRRMWRARKHLMPDYKDVHVLALWANDKSVIITTKKPIKTMADLKGLKIRTPSKLMGGLLKAWGAVPVPMPAPKIYTSMQTGVIDGVFIGASGIRSFKLGEVGKHFTLGLPTNFTTFFLVMNKKSWNTLAPADKKALASVSGEKASIKAAGAYDKAGKGGIALAKKMGRNIIQLSDKASAEFRAKANEFTKRLIADREKKGIPAGKIVTAIRKKM